MSKLIKVIDVPEITQKNAIICSLVLKSTMLDGNEFLQHCNFDVSCSLSGSLERNYRVEDNIAGECTIFKLELQSLRIKI